MATHDEVDKPAAPTAPHAKPSIIPKLIPYIVFFAAYVGAGGLGQGLDLIPGMTIIFWPPAGIFVATLLVTDKRSWPLWILTAASAELTCNAIWFHNPVHFALVYFGANALEASTAAWLVQRFSPPPFRMRSLEQVLALVLLGAGVAPVVGATLIAATDALRGRHDFWTAWPLVWLGDSSGLLVSTPLTLSVVHAWRHRESLRWSQFVEGLLVASTLWVVTGFALTGALPTPYLALPPLLWLALRFHLAGAASGLSILTVATATYGAASHAVVSTEASRAYVVMLQTFLAVSAISSLLVAALAWRHDEALRKLKSANSELEQRVAERTASLAASELRFRTMASSAPSGIFRTDRDGACTYVNDWILEATGTSPEAALGFGWASTVHSDDLPALMGTWQEAFREAQPFTGEFRLLRPDGRATWVVADAAPEKSPEGVLLGYVGTMQDIDAHKRGEEALRQVNEELERRVAERTSDLLQANEQLNGFTYSVAHDLRQSIRGVVLNAQMVAQDYSESLAPEARESLERLATSGKRMSELVDDLLKYARISRLQPSREPIDLTAMAREIAAELAERYPRATIDVQDGLQAFGDPSLLRLALENLLDNACKYVKQEAPCQVEVGHDGSAFFVRDDGIGFEEKYHRKIFEPFERLDVSDRYPGTGIGLANVERVIAKHGGRIWVQSGPGKGSCFLFTLGSTAAVEQAGDSPSSALAL